MYDSAMRNFVLVAMMLAVACGGPVSEAPAPVEATVSPEQVQQEVEQAERNWATAVTTNDAATLEQVYDERLIYAHSSGLVETKADYMAKLDSGATRYDVIDYEQLEVLPFQDGGVAHSLVRMQGENAEGPFNNRLLMTQVWTSDSGEWRMLLHQTTLLEAVE
jgi:ketosteroid isomerase-like protein